MPAWFFGPFFGKGRKSGSLGDLYTIRNNLLCIVAGVAVHEKTSYKVMTDSLAHSQQHPPTTQRITKLSLISLSTWGHSSLSIPSVASWIAWDCFNSFICSWQVLQIARYTCFVYSIPFLCYLDFIRLFATCTVRVGCASFCESCCLSS